MKSPFQYGTLVDKESFVNRVEERKQLKELLGSGINVMLISPRRWGKSSLVKVAMDELTQEDKHIRVCFIDAFSIKTEAEFYRIFAREVISCAASTLEKRLEDVKQFLKAVSPSITLKSDPTDTLSFDLKLELEEKSVMEILELPEKIAAAKGIHLIVCIDEFQQLALLPGYKSMEGKMRSAWQKQQQVSYCFYGSKRHMMMDIFNNSSNPFYRFGQVLFLQKIKKEEWVPFIVNAFHRTNKEISEQQAEQLCDIVKCHSWYLQQLCYFIWSGTSEKVTDEIIEIRTRQLIDTNMPMFMNDTENLTAAQTAMLRAVADGEYRFNSIPVVRKYELGSAQTITRNKRMPVSYTHLDVYKRQALHYPIKLYGFLQAFIVARCPEMFGQPIDSIRAAVSLLVRIQWGTVRFYQPIYASILRINEVVYEIPLRPVSQFTVGSIAIHPVGG